MTITLDNIRQPSIPADCREDEHVLRLLQRHDPKGPSALLEQFGERVFRLTYGILKSEEDAKDAMLETFITVLKKWPTFKEEARFSSWIHRIAHNQACMMLRKKRSRARWFSLEADLNQQAPSFQHEQTLGDRLGEDFQTPSRELERCELKGQIEQAIESLDPTYRRAYRLKEVDGLSLKQIAKVLGLTESAVKTRVFRARQQLRTKLAPLMN